MQAHRKQVPAIKLAMNIAGHGDTGLNILRSHSKNSYTAVSGGLLNCQSFNHRGTQGKFVIIAKIGNVVKKVPPKAVNLIRIAPLFF